MTKFVSLLIDHSHERYLALALWVATFLVVLLAGAMLWGELISQRMEIDGRQMLDPQPLVFEDFNTTMQALEQIATAVPCSPAFHDQLRQVAYLPDGFNEFIYAPEGVARCSVDADFTPYDLGAPASPKDENGVSIWYDRSLAFLGRPRLSGTIATKGAFGIVIPPRTEPISPTSWLRFEQVDVLSDHYFHRAGEVGIYVQARTAGALTRYFPLQRGAYFNLVCLPSGNICMATMAPVFAVARAYWQVLVIGLLLSAILALGISGQIHGLIKRFWSFDARFARHFHPHSVMCTYQPIMSLATGKISGCEVLVRWRDVDGATIYPDLFLPTVEKLGLGRKLTEFVITRAYAELSAQIPEGFHLQVNINVFPRDLDAVWLRETLAVFDAECHRFDPVVEIIETDLLQAEHAQREIEALRRFGIRTHLDDFGTGYSNIENLARLPVDGVKLDRSFAMSSADSLMARMLVNAIEMIHAAGHRITVEGVETEERLAMLKATGHVDFVQGYLIARPLDIDRFVQLLMDQSRPTPLRATLVA